MSKNISGAIVFTASLTFLGGMAWLCGQESKQRKEDESRERDTIRGAYEHVKETYNDAETKWGELDVAVQLDLISNEASLRKGSKLTHSQTEWLRDILTTAAVRNKKGKENESA